LDSYERWADSFKAALQMFDEAGVSVIFSWHPDNPHLYCSPWATNWLGYLNG
jgi:hypothetical protein